MLRYHIQSMGARVRNLSPNFFDNMSVVLNENNPGRSFNKKTVAFSYHFVREHVANDVAEVRKITTKENYADLFTKALVSNEVHLFSHE